MWFPGGGIGGVALTELTLSLFCMTSLNLWSRRTRTEGEKRWEVKTRNAFWSQVQYLPKWWVVCYPTVYLHRDSWNSVKIQEVCQSGMMLQILKLILLGEREVKPALLADGARCPSPCLLCQECPVPLSDAPIINHSSFNVRFHRLTLCINEWVKQSEVKQSCKMNVCAS